MSAIRDNLYFAVINTLSLSKFGFHFEELFNNKYSQRYFLRNFTKEFEEHLVAGSVPDGVIGSFQ